MISEDQDNHYIKFENTFEGGEETTGGFGMKKTMSDF